MQTRENFHTFLHSCTFVVLNEKEYGQKYVVKSSTSMKRRDGGTGRRSGLKMPRHQPVTPSPPIVSRTYPPTDAHSVPFCSRCIKMMVTVWAQIPPASVQSTYCARALSDCGERIRRGLVYQNATDWCRPRLRCTESDLAERDCGASTR